MGGVARFAGCKINRAGHYTLRVAARGLAAAGSTATVTVGAAAQLRFVQEPSDTRSLVPFPSQPHVQLLDLGGNVVTNGAGVVTLSIETPAGAILTCTGGNSTTATSGEAQFGGCNIDKSGSYTLLATLAAAGVSPATSSPLTINAADADHLVFTTSPSNSTGGTPFTTQPEVTVEDATGNIVTDDSSPVALTITTAAGATLTCDATSVAADNGVARFGGCAIDRSSPTAYTLDATDGALTAATSAPTLISAGAATHLGFADQPGDSTGGIALSQQPRVAARDAGGNIATSAAGNVTLTITQPSAPVGAALVCTTSNVRALVAGLTPAFSGCAIDQASSTTYTLFATDDDVGVSATTSSTFAITIGPAAQLAFVTSPDASTGGVAFTQQPRVAALDAGGNLATAATGNIALTITQPSAPVGAVLTCTTSNGRALAGGLTPAFSGCAIDKKSTTTYTLVATDDNLAGVTGTSSAFAVTTGPAAKLAFVTSPNDSTGGIPFTRQPRVAVQDAGGNTVTGNHDVVTLDITRTSDPAAPR